MKNAPILFLFCILFFSCKKENAKLFVENRNVDSLLSVAYNTKNTKLKLAISNEILKDIEQDKIDSITRKRCISLAGIYFSLNEETKCVQLSKLLISNPSVPVNDYEVAFSNYFVGFYNINAGNYESAFLNFSKAEKSFVALKNLEYLGYTLNFKADILTFKKDYSGAEVLSIKALKIAKDKQYYNLMYSCYLTLGNSLSGLNDYNKAIEYYNKAINTSEKLKLNPNFNSFSLMPLDYMSIIYQKQKQFKKSIEYAQKGLNFENIKSKEPLIYCYLTNNLAYSKFKLGDKSSVKYFIETLKIGDSLKFAPIQITSKTYLGEYYLAQKDTLKANFYLKEAQVQSHKNNIFEDELKILQLLSQTNPNDESFYSSRYITLNDSLQVVERATRDKFARIEFETDEITTERNSLSAEKEYLSFQRLIILGISILSIIVIVLWFMNKSQKAKTRELLLKQEQQKANEEIYQLMIDQQQKVQEGKNVEKQRISLELHDGVMGKLSAVRLNLYAALYKANLIEDETFSLQIDEIQAVEQEIRNIAHDLNSNLFSDNSNFIAIVKELFTKIENHSKIQFTLHVSDAVNWDLINNVVKINLYRILQEALQNIEKYAEAKNVAVIMTKTESDELQIEISDDGKGFDTTLKKNGIGLNNMKKRVAELNGKLDIQSALKKGTKINLMIPF